MGKLLSDAQIRPPIHVDIGNVASFVHTPKIPLFQNSSRVLVNNWQYLWRAPDFTSFSCKNAFKCTAQRNQINLLNNSGIISLRCSVFLRCWHGSILEGVVGFPEKIFAIVLQAFVEDAEDKDYDHWPYESAGWVDSPGIEENGFFVAAVELK